ncbi:MAG: orotidine-5'-phosphate decarboxylase [Desulfatiglans sp.]|jgi:orotidine-5'-phosphate decarboxylase|nr:orotidine-5'-phosphate decarboxylase [Desulfatiglans sp.]
MPIKRPEERIIFPLDFPSFDKAMEYVEILKGHIGLFKIGLELFISEGPKILKAVHEAGGTGIFLDLKLHDIPVTVRRALKAASAYGPDFITVHCDEGGDVLKEVTGNSPKTLKILAVTVLTSLNRKKLLRLGYAGEYAEDISNLVLLRARIAKEAGCHGVVCSGHEAAMIKGEFGRDLIVVTPGIRPAWSLVGQDDQERIVTPEKAIKNGADYIVVGRPIRDAKSPQEAAKRVAGEIGSAL